MFKVVRKHKNPKARKLAIYDESNKIVTYAIPCWGWYSFTTRLEPELHKKCRCLVIENFYWLIGNNCDFDDWKESIEKWDKGLIYNVPLNELPSSMFFEGEKEIALNSYYQL